VTLVWVVCLVSCMVSRWETLLHLSFFSLAFFYQGWSCFLVEGFLISMEDSLIAASGSLTSYLGS